MEKTQNVLEKAEFLLMTKHATENDLPLKMQLFISNSGSSSSDICSEKSWSKGRFYKDERSDFGIEKVNYPENSLLYVNQGYLTNHFILGQVIPAANVPTDVDIC